MKAYRLLATALLLMSTGCTSILVATTDENGLQEDPGIRTAGTVVEDEAIETKVTVNMKSMEPAFRDAHFNVISHNGVVLSRTNDSWISTKVRTQMAANDNVPSRQIRVITENGVVYLMGMVSEAQGDRAALLARNITGVSKVVKVFEYI